MIILKLELEPDLEVKYAETRKNNVEIIPFISDCRMILFYFKYGY